MNFEITTTAAITPVVTAPTALTTSFHFQPSSRRRWWWRTMPACESVKPVNTPNA